MSIAVVIIAYNEEKHIVETIASAKQVADEIIVADSGSTDATVELAEKNGAKVVFRAWDDDFAAQRNFASDSAQSDYVFHLDADERINEKLAKSIKTVCQNNGQKIFSMRRVNMVFGKVFKFGEMRPDVVTRLYPRGKAHWEGHVHEKLVSDLPSAKLEGDILHYTYEDWSLFLNKVNKYTTIWAEAAFERGKRTSLWGAIGHAAGAFFKGLVLKLAFAEGAGGLITTFMHSMYTLLKYVKLFQLQREQEGSGTGR